MLIVIFPGTYDNLIPDESSVELDTLGKSDVIYPLGPELIVADGSRWRSRDSKGVPRLCGSKVHWVHAHVTHLHKGEDQTPQSCLKTLKWFQWPACTGFEEIT